MAKRGEGTDCAGAEEGQALGNSNVGQRIVNEREGQPAPASAPDTAVAIARSSSSRRYHEPGSCTSYRSYSSTSLTSISILLSADNGASLNELLLCNQSLMRRSGLHRSMKSELAMSFAAVV